MRFSKAIKRIIALGTGATMMGATLMGAMAADLSEYPTPFIKDGKFTGVMVIGNKAAAEDVIGVSDIAVSLQFSATTAAGTTTAGLDVAGEAWEVRKGATNVMEMSENLDSGNNRETIATITGGTYIDDGDLPVLLAGGTASNSKGESPYEQRIYFEDTATGYVQYLEDGNDITADFLYFQSGKQIARYELEFTSALESDVDDSGGTQTSTGDYLTDLEDTEIVMLGKTYSVVQARRNGAKQGQVKLILMGGAVKDTLLEGETKTYTIDGKDFETTLDYVDADEAKFTINGESTRKLKDGDTDKLSDDTTVGVSEILYQDYAGGIHSSTFFLGAQKFEFKDTNINTSNGIGYSNELKVDDETIDGSLAWIEGSDDQSTYKVDKIVVNMSADDDYYVPAGGKLSENTEMDEPDLLFTRNLDIEYKGLSDELLEKTDIKSAGSDDYNLIFVDGNGNEVKIPLAHTTSGTALRMGDNDDDLVIEENMTIQKNDYFIVTDESDTDGERKSFGLRYKGADKITADNPVVKFVDLGSGETIERSISAPSSQSGGVGQGGKDLSELAQIKLGGGIFRVYNDSAASSKDFDIVVDLNASGNPVGDGNAIPINTKYGMRMTIDNTTTTGQINLTMDTPNSDDYDDLVPTSMYWIINATGGEVRLLEQNLHNLRAPEDDDKNTYGYNSMGAFVQRTTPTSDPQELYIQYPKNQRLPLVYVTGKGATFTTTETAAGEAVVVNRIEVGATKLASEVADIKAVNAIIVGGPVANAAAMEIMGSPADPYAIGIGPGEALIKLYENDGNVAMLVAGYGAADTRAAAKVIANHGDYAADLKGTALKLTSGTMGLTEFTEPAAEEETTTTEEETTTTEETTA